MAGKTHKSRNAREQMFQFLQQQIKKDILPRSREVISDRGIKFLIIMIFSLQKIMAGKGVETNND
jgi:hypothetical protein